MSSTEKTLLYIVIGLLLFGLVNLYCHGVPYQSNVAGFILAGFSVLVTTLVGWQIYSFINIDKKLVHIERKIERQSEKLKRESILILDTSNMSKDYCQGVFCLSFAMTQYYEIIRRRQIDIKRKRDNREEELKQLVNIYVISIRAMFHLVQTNLKKDEFPSDIIELCTQGIELAHKAIFHSYYLSFWTKAFSEEDHNNCNKYYDTIRAHSDKIDRDIMFRITDLQSRRESFRKKLKKTNKKSPQE